VFLYHPFGPFGAVVVVVVFFVVVDDFFVDLHESNAITKTKETKRYFTVENIFYNFFSKLKLFFNEIHSMKKKGGFKGKSSDKMPFFQVVQ